MASASQKDASGTSTFPIQIAVKAQRTGAGSTVPIDIDPLSSLADWQNRREDELAESAAGFGRRVAR